MPSSLAPRSWLPDAVSQRVAGVQVELDRLVEENRQIHQVETVNPDPATNVMNPRAEAMLSAQTGSQPSLGYPGDKHEVGLEAIEQVEVIARIAHDAGARLLFDAAHVCGLIAGGAWPTPLRQGADLMTTSTYKSLGGPPSGLVVTDDAELAQRLEGIACPGLTATFDAVESAALAVTMLGWKAAGQEYARTMVDVSQRLAEELVSLEVPVFAADRSATASHQLAVEAAVHGGGQRAARRLREANLLTCAIGLPVEDVVGDMDGLRLGTPEIVRRGVTPEDVPELAALVARALDEATDLRFLAG